VVGTLVSGELLKLRIGGDEGTVRGGRCMDSSILSPKCCLPTLLSPHTIYSLAWLLGWYAWRLSLKLLVCAPSPNRDRQTDTHTRTHTCTHTCTHTPTHTHPTLHSASVWLSWPACLVDVSQTAGMQAQSSARG